MGAYRSQGELKSMVGAVLQGMGYMEAMLQNQAVMLNGIVQHCQALEHGQQVLLQGQAIIIHGQKVLLEEVLSLHSSVNNVLMVRVAFCTICVCARTVCRQQSKSIWVCMAYNSSCHGKVAVCQCCMSHVYDTCQCQPALFCRSCRTSLLTR